MALTSRHRIAAALLAGSMLLAACSSDTSSDSASASASASDQASDAASADAPVEKGDDTRTSVEGEFGSSATMTFEDGDPAPGLNVEYVTKGDGPEVGADDTVVVHYVGQVWQGDVFDSSFDRGAPTSFPLNGVVRGWKEGLTGVPVGSRVIISVPPELGYGEAGNAGAGIEGTDTIVFTVDVIDAYSADSASQADAAPTGADVPVTYSGDLGQPVSELTITEGAAEPTEPQTIVVAEGTGEPVGPAADGSVAVFQYAATSWDGQITESTWDFGQPVSLPIQGSYFEGLEGVPVGSRVVVLVPGQDGAGTGQPTPALAAVVDVIGQTGGSASAGN